jgi:hypothetical protein
MQSIIEQLFGYLDRGELSQLRNNLSADVVNTRMVSSIAAYDYSPKRVFSASYGEVHYELLLFRAMLLKSYNAFKMLLDYGADLLLMEKFDCTYQGQLIPGRQPLETDIALICVTNSKDIQFIQITFDHICTHALYEKPFFIEFLLEHLREVNLEKFRPEFLKIDVGNPLPRQFEDTDEYKQFLVENGIDISGFFFYKSQYLDYLTNPSNPIDKDFLGHALQVCEFTLEEIQRINEALPTEELKGVLVSHNTKVNTALLVDINEMLGELEAVEEVVEEKAPQKKSRARSPELEDGVPKPIPIRPEDQQEYDHLEKKRLPMVQSTIRALSGKAKLSSKERAELKAAQISLADCMSRFHANPVYKKKKMEEALRLSPDLPEAGDEAGYQQGSPSI